MNEKGAVGVVCHCGKCRVCGWHKHNSIHMHDYPDGPPLGHGFEPTDRSPGASPLR